MPNKSRYLVVRMGCGIGDFWIQLWRAPRTCSSSLTPPIQRLPGQSEPGRRLPRDGFYASAALFARFFNGIFGQIGTALTPFGEGEDKPALHNLPVVFRPKFISYSSRSYIHC